MHTRCLSVCAVVATARYGTPLLRHAFLRGKVLRHLVVLLDRRQGVLGRLLQLGILAIRDIVFERRDGLLITFLHIDLRYVRLVECLALQPFQ